MPYCTKDEVKAELKALTTTSTTPIVSDANLDAWISQSDAEIDSRLATKFVVPITGTESLKIVKTISTYIVAERAARKLELMASPPIQTEGKTIITIGKGTAKDGRKMIEDIMEGKMVLSDATLKSSSMGIRSHNVSCEQEHKYKRNRDQW